MKRNVTIALDEETARWTRVQAAKRDMSVSRFLAEILERSRAETDGYEAAMEGFLAREPRRLGGGPYPSRDEAHAR